MVVVFQLAALAALRAQPGYVRSRGSSDVSMVQSPENFALYLMDLAQFIIVVSLNTNMRFGF